MKCVPLPSLSHLALSSPSPLSPRSSGMHLGLTLFRNTLEPTFQFITG